MNKIYTLLSIAFISCTVGCTKMGQRIAYGKTVTSLPTLRTPASTVDAVNQAVEVARVVENQQQQLNQQKRREQEDKYAADQSAEMQTQRFIELRNNYLMLKDRIDAVETENKRLTRENNQLSLTVTQLTNQSQTHGLELERLRKALDDYTDRLLNTQQVASPTEHRTPDPKFSALGSPSSAYGTTNGNTSARPVSTRATYTPRAAPVRQYQQVYHLGPRGGCYYYTNSGRKEYVDRSLCR